HAGAPRLRHPRGCAGGIAGGGQSSSARQCGPGGAWRWQPGPAAAERGAGGLIARLGVQTSALFQRWLKKRIPASSQVRLNHRRIFIMPTRAGMGLLLLLLIMLIGAINYQNSLIYAVVFLLGSLFWVGLHHTYRNLAGL